MEIVGAGANALQGRKASAEVSLARAVAL